MLGTRENITGLGEGGHPPVAVPNGMPADMIDLQMGRQNMLDFFRLNARLAHQANSHEAPSRDSENLSTKIDFTGQERRQWRSRAGKFPTVAKRLSGAKRRRHA